MDFSTCSKAALRWASTNMVRGGDRLVLIHVNSSYQVESGIVHLWEQDGSRTLTFLLWFGFVLSVLPLFIRLWWIFVSLYIWDFEVDYTIYLFSSHSVKWIVGSHDCQEIWCLSWQGNAQHTGSSCKSETGRYAVPVEPIPIIGDSLFIQNFLKPMFSITFFLLKY